MRIIRYWTSARLLRWIMGCLAVVSMAPLLLYNYTATLRTGALLLETAGQYKAILRQYVKELPLNLSSQRDISIPVAIAPDDSGWGAQCTGIPTPVVLPSQLRNHSWQSGNDMNKVKIFSAFYDDRTTSQIGAVQVLGMYSGTSIPKFCHLVYGSKSGAKRRGDSPSEEETPNQLSVFITTAACLGSVGSRRKKYIPAIYTCPVKFPGKPLGVSLVSEKCHVGNSSLYLKVQDDHGIQPLYNFTVCVAPLYQTDIMNIRRFIEHVEINKAFGADRFVYYNHSVGDEFVKTLQHYGLEGLNEVVQWTLPVDIDEVVYYAQTAAQNDCLLRYMYKSKYVVFTDLDEFIIPKDSTNWHDMLKQIIDKEKPRASYVIRNVFFHLEFSDHQNALEDVDVQALEIMPLKKLRSEKPQKFGVRSKYICDPRLSFMATVHSLVRSANNVLKQMYVPERIAMLHHYRNWGVKEGTQNSTLDMSMYRFRDLIVSNIRKAHRKLCIPPVKVRPTGSQ